MDDDAWRDWSIYLLQVGDKFRECDREGQVYVQEESYIVTRVEEDKLFARSLSGHGEHEFPFVVHPHVYKLCGIGKPR